MAVGTLDGYLDLFRAELRSEFRALRSASGPSADFKRALEAVVVKFRLPQLSKEAVFSARFLDLDDVLGPVLVTASIPTRPGFDQWYALGNAEASNALSGLDSDGVVLLQVPTVAAAEQAVERIRQVLNRSDSLAETVNMHIHQAGEAMLNVVRNFGSTQASLMAQGVTWIEQEHLQRESNPVERRGVLAIIGNPSELEAAQQIAADLLLMAKSLWDGTDLNEQTKALFEDDFIPGLEEVCQLLALEPLSEAGRASAGRDAIAAVGRAQGLGAGISRLALAGAITVQTLDAFDGAVRNLDTISSAIRATIS